METKDLQRSSLLENEKDCLSKMKLEGFREEPIFKEEGRRAQHEIPVQTHGCPFETRKRDAHSTIHLCTRMDACAHCTLSTRFPCPPTDARAIPGRETCNVTQRDIARH